MKILAIHAGNAILNHHDLEVTIECRKSGIHNARIGIDAHQDHGFDVERAEENFQIGAVKAIQALFKVWFLGAYN